MISVELPPRGQDDFGSGEFGASRDGGTRSHVGVDFAAPVDGLLRSKTDGKVTKHGTVYENDASFKYVEVTSDDGARHRYYYVKPDIRVGQKVSQGDFLGKVQNIAGKYSTKDKKMKNHVHYEIKDTTGSRVDPHEYWK